MKEAYPSFRDSRFAGVSRQDALICAAIFCAALFVRLLYLYFYSRTPYWDTLILDPGTHWQMARDIAEGKGMGPYPYFRSPFYFYLLAGFIKIFPEPLWPFRIFQSLLGSLTASFTFVIARHYLGRTASAAAGLLFGLYWAAVYFDGEMLIAGPATFLGAASVLSILLADSALQKNTRKWPRFGPAGVMVGLSCLARPNYLVFAAAVPAFLLLREILKARKEKAPLATNMKRPLAAALLFCLGVGACIAPVTVRNRVTGGEWMLLASQGGINFWIGNNENADGRTVVVPLPRRTIPLRYLEKNKDHPWINENVWITSKYVAEKEKGRALTDGQVSDYWYQRALKWMKENPAQSLGLLTKKTLYLFQAREVGNNRDIIYHRRNMPVLKTLGIVNTAWIMPLVLAGLVLAMARPAKWSWPLIFYLCYAATVIAFFVTSRYRLPLFPVGMCLAAFTAESLYTQWQTPSSKRRLSRTGALLVLVLACAFVVNMDHPKWNERPLRSAMHYNQGMALYQKQEYDDARKELQYALQVKDHYPEAHFWLGKMAREQGRLKEAASAFRKCLEQAPYYAPAHYELGRTYLDMANDKQDEYHRKGREHLYKAHRLAPEHFPPP